MINMENMLVLIPKKLAKFFFQPAIFSASVQHTNRIYSYEHIPSLRLYSIKFWLLLPSHISHVPCIIR